MDNTDKIRKLEEELKKLKEEQREYENLDPSCKVAEELHSALCHSNHVDQCDWHYGNWKNPTHAHREYLKIAKECLKITDKDTCIKIAKILK